MMSQGDPTPFCHTYPIPHVFTGGSPIVVAVSRSPEFSSGAARQSQQSPGIIIYEKKGVLKAFNSTPYTATVQVQGSLSVWLEKHPGKLKHPLAEMFMGQNADVLFLDQGNPADAVVVAVWT